MNLTTNSALFNLSGNNVPLVSEVFVHSFDEVVISKNSAFPNELQIATQKIRECLAALNCLDDQPKSIQKPIIEKLVEALETPGVNFTEFASFWAVADMSYSLYQKLNKEEKAKAVEELSRLYLRYRHELYNCYGFSDTTLQVRADQSSHKKNGRIGIVQMRFLLKKANFIECNGEEDFISMPANAFLSVDSHKTKFKEFLSATGTQFSWAKEHQNKLPDLLLKIGEKFWIIEHKHIKECGGGQNKQLTELIELIHGCENPQVSVGYIAFLDGILFRDLFFAKTSGKLKTAKNDILKALQKFPNNYFLNAFGFETFIRERILV